MKNVEDIKEFLKEQNDSGRYTGESIFNNPEGIDEQVKNLPVFPGVILYLNCIEFNDVVYKTEVNMETAWIDNNLNIISREEVMELLKENK